MREQEIKTYLQKARHLIASGWGTGSYKNNGCYCTLGAINEVTSGDHSAYWDKRSIQVQDYIMRFVPLVANVREQDSAFFRISKFNDTSEQADVLAMFDKAIAA